MKIYTGRGDFGKTDTLSGARLMKNSALIQLNGSLDEVSASIGYLSSLMGTSLQRKQNREDADKELQNLTWVQNVLYHIGVEVSSSFSQIYIDAGYLSALESKIDRLDRSVAPLTEFILYSGSVPATYAQVTRATVRRCERDYVMLLSDLNRTDTPPHSYIFINRLSDYFFMLSRYLNQSAHIKEENVTTWKRKENPGTAVHFDKK